jgi:RNA-directed DNA polymerase
MSEPIKSNSKIGYLDRLTWDEIKWSYSYERVRSIQKRIFKASLKSDRKRVWFLQKLLLRNPHAKLIAVHTVTTLNKGKLTAGTDGITITSPSEKLLLAKQLQINGKANTIRRVWIPKPGKKERRPLGIPTIHDRAKQALCKLVLEPEWEAQFEPNSYGFRPGRRCQDAIEAIYQNIHFNVDKYVYDADISKCFDKIDHKALLLKLKTFHLMEKQISSWLTAGIFDVYACRPKTSIPNTGTPQGGIISPLLANIALHGLENHLLNYVSSSTMPKPHENAARGSKAKMSALGIIRYADDFVLIHRNKEIMDLVIKETRIWLHKMGLSISEEKTNLSLSSQSFKFLGFQIAYVKRNNKFRVKITPSKENVIRLIEKTRDMIHINKASSAYQLIGKLRPIILGWGNYYQFCECKDTFSKIDSILFQQIRAWVFRRSARQSRNELKNKYFPEGRTYLFQNREYKANWILNGMKVKKDNEMTFNYLPKISWIKSEKHVKVLQKESVYSGNEIYWAFRTPRYSILSTRVKNLLIIQKGKCKFCLQTFKEGEIMEVDYKIQKSKGGADSYINLQLLHRHCHIIKTKNDLEKDLDKRFLEKESLGKASQELDEGKLSRPDRKTGLSRNRPL